MKSPLLFLFLLLFSSSLFSQNSYVIHAGKVLAKPGSGYLSEQSILVENGKINSVKKGYLNPAELGASSELKVLDLKDKYVLPGLIDMHVHVTGERDPKANPHEWTILEREDMALRCVPYLKRTLDIGFTTVRDLGAEPNTINAVKRSIAKKIIPGPRIIAALSAITPTGGHGEDLLGYRSEIEHAFPVNEAVCDGSDDCRRAVRALVKQGADVIKITATGGVLSNTKAGVAQQLTDDELASIVATAHSLGRKVAAHAHAADGIKAALRAGVNSIEHGSFLDEECIALFKKTGAYLVPTLLAGVSVLEEIPKNPNIPAAIQEKIKLVAPAMEASFKMALKNKLNIAYGTDSGVSPHGDNAREFELMVGYGMDAETAIKTATINASLLLGMEDEIGSIEKGKIADIIAVDADPILNISNIKRVNFVMKDGEIYKD